MSKVKLTRRRLVGALAGVSTLLAAVLALTFRPPQVVRVDSEFGTVQESTAVVDTRIVVDNSNGWAIPGRHDLEYTVTLNETTVTTGRKTGVRIGSGRTVIETTARFDNTAIPDWWVSHINRNEQTTVRTRARVNIGGLPFRLALPPDTTTIETELLGSLEESDTSTVTLGDRPILSIDDQRAEWGQATGERTPLLFTTALENLHDRPVRIDGTDYEIRMNDIVVGSGEIVDRVEVAPGEATSFTVEATIDTPRMQEWWVSHLRNDQSTTFQVTMDAVAVDDDGTRKRLPMSLVDQQSRFETDMLGSGRTTVEPIEGAPDVPFREPEVTGTETEWGAVRETETDIETTVTVRNDNEEQFSEILSLAVSQSTSIADITVATGTNQYETLSQGENRLELVATKRHAVVPNWWAAHLANGERSTTRTELEGDADVAVTTLPLDIEDRESAVETNLLADLNDSTSQEVTSDEGNVPLFTVHSTTAEWVDPTPETGLIRVEADMENRQQETLSLVDIDARVDINDVTLTDERLSGEYTFWPRQRKTVVFQITLDNSRMEAWWPTHVRGGEQSTVDRQVTATIESSTGSERLPLEFLSETRAFETDLLAG